MKMPQVLQEFYPLGGGLDQQTPAIALKPGRAIDSQNYEPEIAGGYRRVDGYERYDGRMSPTSAVYYTLGISITAAIAIGDTLTGVTSGATARVLNFVGSTYIVGRLTGAFQVGETIQVSAVNKGVALTTAQLQGTSSPSDDADYLLLAANDLRSDIQAVPGSGQVRGVWVYNDTVYAFRDNVGGTAGLMYKATSSGWQLVTFGTEIQFSSSTGGTTPIAAGATIGNAASPTKTATVVAVLTRSGTWGTDAVGTLIITPVTGSFSNADPIFVGATQKATATTAATAIARLPGGRMEFINANFTASTGNNKMYGVDGVNPAFEFDGTTYIPIRTGMATDTPSHLMFHKFYLWLSFRGSVQFSALTNPYAWTVVLGAGEISCGDDVTGFVPQGGNNAGSSMAIFTTRRTYVVYGSSSSDFRLVTSVFELGYSAFTMQPVSNNTFGITPRGIQSLVTTLTYGDFDYSSIAHEVLPFLVARRGLETTSTSLRAKDQYRVFFSDGYAIALGLTGDKITGAMPLNYGKPVRCITTTTLSSGKEVTFFGSDDGYVYQDITGTSFDGNAIEHWIRLPFNHSKSPNIRKRYRKAIVEAKATGYAQLSATYDLGYGNPDIQAAGPIPDVVLTSAGGFWEQFSWDQFSWDTKLVNDMRMSLDGTEKNISFLFYGNRAQDKSHTLQGITICYTPQRMEH